MIKGISIMRSELPCYFIEEHGLEKRIAKREDEREEQELHFLWTDRVRVLPVLVQEQLILAKWGGHNPNGLLPVGKATQLASLESGKWEQWKAIRCMVPAQMGLDRIWYEIEQGIQAILVLDEKKEPVVYLLVEPSTQYYQMMTGSEWEPIFVHQRI